MLPRKPVSVQKRYLPVSTGSKKGLASGHKLNLIRALEMLKNRSFTEQTLSIPYMEGYTISIGYSTTLDEAFGLISRCSLLLAHLSQRLIGELIGYSWSGVRPSSVRRRRPSVVNNFKHLLLRNRWADQSQILCGASLGRGNDILFAASGSHDQDGRHAHIW